MHHKNPNNTIAMAVPTSVIDDRVLPCVHWVGGELRLTIQDINQAGLTVEELRTASYTAGCRPLNVGLAGIMAGHYEHGFPPSAIGHEYPRFTDPGSIGYRYIRSPCAVTR